MFPYEVPIIYLKQVIITCQGGRDLGEHKGSISPYALFLKFVLVSSVFFI